MRKVLGYVLAGILLLPLTAHAFRTTVTHTTKDVNTTSETVVSANVSRNFIRLTNESASAVWCRFGGTATVSSGIFLYASTSVMYDYKVPTGALACIHGGSGAKKLHVEEGTGP